VGRAVIDRQTLIEGRPRSDALSPIGDSCGSKRGVGSIGSEGTRMTLEGLSWIVIANGLVQLAGLILMIRNHREIVRMTRGLAGLVYQESEKTRARLDELLGPASRR
jgi:hypothetical protein